MKNEIHQEWINVFICKILRSKVGKKEKAKKKERKIPKTAPNDNT